MNVEHYPLGHNDAIIIIMRTTLTLPDDVYDVAKTRAEAKRISIGEAVGEMVRQAMAPTVIDADELFPRFRVPERTPKVTMEEVLAAKDEL